MELVTLESANRELFGREFSFRSLLSNICAPNEYYFHGCESKMKISYVVKLNLKVRGTCAAVAEKTSILLAEVPNVKAAANVSVRPSII